MIKYIISLLILPAIVLADFEPDVTLVGDEIVIHNALEVGVKTVVEDQTLQAQSVKLNNAIINKTVEVNQEANPIIVKAKEANPIIVKAKLVSTNIFKYSLSKLKAIVWHKTIAYALALIFTVIGLGLLYIYSRKLKRTLA